MNDATLSADASKLIAPPAAARQSQFRLIAACSIGNALEMYDFTVYSFFALLIGRLFSPPIAPMARSCSPWRPSASVSSCARSAAL